MNSKWGSSSAFSRRTVGCSFKFEIGDQEQVDDIGGVVGLVDDNGSTARGRHDELAVLDRDRSSIREMDDERTKRLSVRSRAEFLDRHRIISL